MANYSLVANSVFQPFTYQELVAPIAHQQQVFDNLAEQYDQLSSQADILEAMGANDKTSGAYGKYKAYSDRLRNEANNLFRNGLDSESRMRLSELRRMYNTDIVPIQNAWNKRKEEAELQMKARISNPSLRFTRDAASSSIDDYLANPEGGFGVVNLDSITAQMAGMAKNLEDSIISGHKEGIDDFTFDYVRRHGLDANMINRWIQNPNSNPALTNMMNQVLERNGINPEMLRSNSGLYGEALNAAKMGAWESIGKTEAQAMPDWQKRQDYEFNQQVALQQIKDQMELRKEAMKASLQGAGNLPKVTSVGVGLVPTENYRAENMKVLETLKGGNNAFKSRYFGSVVGKINPMKLYEEVNAGNKKEDVLRKYSKYGVRDIITKDQYEAMKSLGYDSNSAFKPKRYSDMMKDFDALVEQRSRYSTNMADYESFNDKAIPNLLSRSLYDRESGTVWEIKKDGKRGNPASIKSMNLYTKDNTKGNKITDVQYDPQYKGKIVIQLSDGKMYIADPGIYDSNLANLIADGERNGAPAIDITRAIVDSLNERNKVKGKTDSKIE